MFEECVKTIQDNLELDIDIIVYDGGDRCAGTFDITDVRFDKPKKAQRHKESRKYGRSK